MSSTATALSQTLKSITITKIAKLEKQRISFANRKHDILDAVENAATNQRERVSILLSGVKELDLPLSSGTDLSNIQRWINQSDFDDSIPQSMLIGFEEQLRSLLDVQTRRLDLADLYSRLLREWLNSSDEGEEIVEEDGSLDGSFEVVEKDRLKQLRDKFEAAVFTSLDTNSEEIQEYLNGLFESEEDGKALERLRREVGYLGSRAAAPAPFDKHTLNWCIKGLLNNELLKDEKKAILEEFRKDEVARGEICDVLNMQYADLQNWSWDAGDDGLPVEPRRQANGKYRVMMDEDVLQAIFLHYIGMTWSCGIKPILCDLVRYTGIWNQSARLPQSEVDRRRYYLGGYRSQQEAEGGLHSERLKMYQDDLFLSQLPTKVWEGAGGYDGDEDEDEGPTRKSPKEIKQQLLRQLATELRVRQTLDGEAAIVQSDFRWFGTSLSHTTITSVLRFVGVPEHWVAFFKKFLEAPLNMSPVSDGISISGQVRIRRRGVPIAHALEKFFGELVLFFMDLAVNQQAGTLLYRFHDDLWLCDQPERCANAWQTMEKFAKIMGLEFNLRKTGSVYLTTESADRDEDIAAKLPKGPVYVGFLVLDPETGNWILDQKEVDAHVGQLQKQLAKCTSILSWVRTWNSCIGRFFSHSFGEPANCFGKAHVDSILETHKRIQRQIFNGKDGNGNSVTSHLKGLIAERFGITDVLDAFIWMPEQLGGLGVRNPFISGFLVRDQVYSDPQKRLRQYLVQEKDEYENSKKEFEARGERGRRRDFHNIFTNEYGNSSSSSIPEEDLNTFMSFEDFTCWREATSPRLCSAYKSLMLAPLPQGAIVSMEVSEALRKLAKSQPELKLVDMDPETKWLLQLHSEELFERCGNLSMVDKNLLPLGILEILRKKRVTWQMVL
jgi:hypothetical protein